MLIKFYAPWHNALCLSLNMGPSRQYVMYFISFNDIEESRSNHRLNNINGLLIPIS